MQDKNQIDFLLEIQQCYSLVHVCLDSLHVNNNGSQIVGTLQTLIDKLYEIEINLTNEA